MSAPVKAVLPLAGAVAGAALAEPELELELPLDELVPEAPAVGGAVVGADPVDDAVAAHVTVTGNDAVFPLVTPVAMMLCDPQSSPAGIVTVMTKFPLGSAVVEPRLTGVLWNVRSIVSFGVNPVPEIVSLQPVL